MHLSLCMRGSIFCFHCLHWLCFDWYLDFFFYLWASPGSPDTRYEWDEGQECQDEISQIIRNSESEEFRYPPYEYEDSDVRQDEYNRQEESPENIEHREVD